MAKQMLNQSLIQPDARVLPTLERDGRRRWLTPRLGLGRFLTARRIVAYMLIALFTLLPFISINGRPAILLDVLHRRFTLFGYTFLPTDTMLLAILMVAIILAVFFFTALAGRLWCGWACPQTVYTEFLFRPIERLCMGKSGVGGKPTREVAGWRLGAMYLLFLLASLYLAHTFLSYFVGVHELRQWTTQSPANHPASFLIILVVTAAMMFDFAYFREQTCLIACPYGRLQAVLLDRDSLIIQYDRARGEPRGRKKSQAKAAGLETKTEKSFSLPIVNEASTQQLVDSAKSSSIANGDCVDCTMCVQVCPTGIDIRDGLQFECIACAQCIDACDAVMDKLGRARGLIRYSSQSAMAGRGNHILRARVLIYGLLIAGLVALLTYFIVIKSPFDVHIARQGGLPFTMLPDGRVENVMRLNVTNRSETPQNLQIQVIDAPDVELADSDASIIVNPAQMVQKPIHLIASPAAFARGKRSVLVRLSDSKGNFLDRRCQLFGPGTAATKEVTP